MRPRSERLGGFPAMFITMLAFWFLVSGQFDLQYLVAGIVTAFLVTWYWRGLLRRIQDRHDILPYRFLFCPASVTYFFYLVVQIIKANVAVVMIVLNPRMPISPVVLRTRTVLKHDLTRVAYAHSITLTPGTLTLSLTDDRVVVHSLTEQGADINALGELETRMLEIERRLN